MNEYTENDYDLEFKDYSVEKKRADLECNPFFNAEAVKVGDEKDIVELHKNYFIMFRNAMREVLGEE